MEDLRIKKRRKVNKKKKLQKGTEDDMAGGSELKRTRVEEESFSWLQRCTDGSQHRQVKHKRVKKERASRKQRGTDASRGGSEHHQVEHKKVKHKRVDPGHISHLFDIVKRINLRRAKMALEFYEKRQDAEFEVLEVLNLTGSELQHPESKWGQFWCHVNFIAKPKNTDCNVSPKHFFGELFKDNDSGKFHVTYCSTFEPSDDPGFNHGCIFCPPGEKFHPSNGDFVARPPWYKRSGIRRG